MSYLIFKDAGTSESGLTRKWAATATDSSTILGVVKWFAQWRKYCFFPYDNSLFDAGCLVELAEFCKHQNDVRRQDV
jgi:hypothetical protein